MTMMTTLLPAVFAYLATATAFYAWIILTAVEVPSDVAAEPGFGSVHDGKGLLSRIANRANRSGRAA
ncbi:MAG: hypothetical protein SNJ74_11100 [Fimbriimonadaceae bacterium]